MTDSAFGGGKTDRDSRNGSDRPDQSRRWLLSAVGTSAAVALAGCAETDETGDDEQGDDEMDDNGDPTDDGLPGPSGTLEVLVANAYDDGPVFDDDRMHYSDYTSALHGLGMGYSAMRTSEAGHENYPDYMEVMTERMPETGGYTIDIYDSISGFFQDDNVISAHADVDGGDWTPHGGPSLADYEETVFAYHTHHRGIGRLGRVAEHLEEEGGHDDVVEQLRDQRDTISFGSVPITFANVHWVLDERLEDGEFVDADGNVTRESMCQGMRVLNALGYAWQRRNGPDGAGDAEQPGMGGMGNVAHGTMSRLLGGWDEKALSEAMVEIAQSLDGYWDDDAGAFDFGDGTTYHVTELGALLDGLKAIYEFLYIPQYEDRPGDRVDDYDDHENFEMHPYPGKVQDQGLAMDVLEYAGTMLQSVFEADINWGYGAPTEVEFTDGVLAAASETVDVGASWKFLNQLWGGWCVFRERESEDSPQLLQDNYGDVWDSQVDIIDPALEGAILEGNHLDDDDHVVAAVSHDDGTVEDETVYTATVGNFIMGVENVYRGSDLGLRARDWEEDEPEDGMRFHDVFFANLDLLQDELILHDAP